MSVQCYRQRFYTIDGLELELHAGTRIKKFPTPGIYVEVRGKFDADGKILVDLIKSR